MKDPADNLLHEKVPEFTINALGEKQRVKPLQETNVLIGYVQQKQKDWISEHHIYNIRIDKEITPQVAEAEYLLLYDAIIDGNKLHLWKNGFFRIINNPIIKSKEWLVDKNYPDPGKLEYFVFEISTLLEKWSIDKVVDIYLRNDEDKYRPITRILPEILR